MLSALPTIPIILLMECFHRRTGIVTANGIVLILGNGQAGIALAREIRKLDPRRPITLLGRDA